MKLDVGIPKRLKKQMTFVKALLKLCEKHQLVFSVGCTYGPNDGKVRAFQYHHGIERMREYLE